MRDQWRAARLSAALALWLAGACLDQSLAQAPPEKDDWPARAATLAAATDCAPELTAALDDRHWRVRARAIQALGERRCAAAVPALAARFDAEDWDNQARIIAALGRIGDPAGLPLAARAAEGEAGILRLTALAALGGFDGAQVAPILARALEKALTADEKRLVARHIGRFRLAALAAKLSAWSGGDAELDRDIALARYRTGDQSAGARVIEDFARLDAETQRQLFEDWALQPDARAIGALSAALRSSPPPLAAARAWAALGAQAPLTETLDALLGAEAEARPALLAALRARPVGEAVDAIVARLKASPTAAAQAAYVTILQSLDRDLAASALLAARSSRAPAIDRALEGLGVTPEALKARLSDADLAPAARVETALRLGQLGDATAFETLCQAFASRDRRTRQAAIEALGQLGDARAVEPLLDALDDDDPAIRAATAATLARLGVTPERLAANLDSPNVALRVEALRLLGRLGDASCLPRVTARLREGEPLAVRLAAAAALGRLGRPEAAPALTALLQSREPALRWQAAVALGDIGGERAASALLPLLGDADAALVGAAIEALAKTKSPAAVAPLLAALKRPDWRVRAAVAQRLGEWDDPRIPPALADALNDASALTRLYARQALVKLGVAPLAALLAALDQRGQRGWYSAYEVLRSLAPEAARAELLRRLGSPDPAARAMAAALLRSYRDADTLDALFRQLDAETRYPGRWWLTRAIADFGAAAREGVVKRARSKNPRLRADALRALGLLPPSAESRDLLREALASPEAQTRSAAVEALGRIGDAATLSPLLARQSGGFAVTPDELIDALLACGAAGRAALRQAVPDSDPAVRALLLQRLGEDGHPDALPLLLNALGDPSPLVRRAARQGLARQSDERAAQALEETPEAPR
ncbi:MAG: hypothetical protein CFK52_03490 [Chloracidobacterium sp. CP2_5A]|nr:MAG: hypothetical protein CFK52_03490 [Chloracidobacterium sp. CP2_5A]